MLETLLSILRLDIPGPEIILDEDKESLSLDWGNDITISIDKFGFVAWAVLEPKEHGTNLNRIKEILETRIWQ